MSEQRMVLAQLTADYQYPIPRTDLFDAHAEPGCALQPAIEREIALSQTEIDIGTAHTAQQPLQQIQLFERRMRGSERTDGFRPPILECRFDAARRILERDRPVCFFPFAFAADH